MNCLDIRRSLFSAPNERTPSQKAHLATCAHCARLASDVAALDERIAAAARVPPPHLLDKRILLLPRQRPARDRKLRACAVFAALVATVSVITLIRVDPAADRPLPSEALDAMNPAVAAISFVIDQEPAIIGNRSDDTKAMQERLAQLGLKLSNHGVVVHYVGRCEIAGNDCNHLVLMTPNGKASVILLPDQRVEARVLVSARRKIALVRPARSGSYVVVGGSVEAVKHVETLIERAQVAAASRTGYIEV